MTIEEFLAARPTLAQKFVWFEDELGQLRAHDVRTHAEVDAVEHSTITALAQVRLGQGYDCMLAWDKATEALGLSLEDAMAIVSAEDHDAHQSRALARQLREAVGVQP